MWEEEPEQPLIREGERDGSGLAVGNFLYFRQPKDIEQSPVSIDFAIAIEIVGIIERGVVMVARLAANLHHVVAAESRFGLEPQGDDARHHRRRHRRAAIGIPGVGAAIELEVLHIGSDVGGLGTSL